VVFRHYRNCQIFSTRFGSLPSPPKAIVSLLCFRLPTKLRCLRAFMMCTPGPGPPFLRLVLATPACVVRGRSRRAKKARTETERKEGEKKEKEEKKKKKNPSFFCFSNHLATVSAAPPHPPVRLGNECYGKTMVGPLPPPSRAAPCG